MKNSKELRFFPSINFTLTFHIELLHFFHTFHSLFVALFHCSQNLFPLHFPSMLDEFNLHFKRMHCEFAAMKEFGTVVRLSHTALFTYY